MFDVQVEAAKDFLLRANPVNKKNIAPVRKSSFQHALCDMLFSILSSNVASDLPRCRSPVCLPLWQAPVEAFLWPSCR